jgi:hypothetical protein
MPGVTVRSPLAASQQDDPQPLTTSTAFAAAAEAGVAAAAEADESTWAPPRGSPPPRAVTPLAAGWPSLMVPVNMSRATPTTSTRTSSAAIGANGSANTTRAGTDTCARGRTRAATAAIPYHARAFTRPATAETAIASAVFRWAITPPATDSARKLPASHATARGGGSRCHQDGCVPPWLSASIMPTMIGNAAMKGQENGITATLSAHRQQHAGKDEPRLAVGEQPPQVVVGGERGQRRDLRRDRAGGGRDEREQASLGCGPTRRDEDQCPVPAISPGKPFRTHLHERKLR